MSVFIAKYLASMGDMQKGAVDQESGVLKVSECPNLVGFFALLYKIDRRNRDGQKHETKNQESRDQSDQTE